MQIGFGEQTGKYVRSVLEEHGVTILGGKQVEALSGDDERVEQLVCTDGTTVDAQLVVIGVGAVPDVMTAKGAGLEIGESGGIKVDTQLRASADAVYAAGDCGRVRERAVRRSSPHRAPGCRDRDGQDRRAQHRRLRARGGRGVRVRPVLWSDLSDWLSLEYVGNASKGWDEELVRGSIDDGAFSVWYVKDGVLVAALSIGRPEDLMDARRLIAGRAAVDAIRDAVLDISTDLGALWPPGRMSRA
ncbi:MAG: FAD-dependent oxidoreductase, partial [Patulibacter minatonensis]